MNRSMRSLRCLAVALVVGLVTLSPAFGETLRERFKETYPVRAGAEVSLTNVNGNLEFSSWERDEVLVEATKVVKTMGRSRAEEALEALRIEVESSPGAVIIRTIFPERKGGVSGWLLGRDVDAMVSYKVTLPREIQLDARTVNGNVSVAALAGMLDAKTTNGTIKITESAGKTRAHTTNGSIIAEFRAAADGDCVFSTTNGGITVVVPESTQADVAATTKNGAVKTDFVALVDESEDRWRRKKLRGSINGGGNQLTLETVNGSIQLRKLEGGRSDDEDDPA
jgi:hypothetical protein